MPVAASLKESGNPLILEGSKQNKMFWVVEDAAMENGRDRHYKSEEPWNQWGYLYFQLQGLIDVTIRQYNR